MSRQPSPGPEGSFRVPNSIIQGLTTTTSADLHRLPAFSITTLLGLLTLVDPKKPDAEVCARPSDILEIIEVGKQVANAVDRSWMTTDGQERSARYQTTRYSPKHRQQVHEALLRLHNQSVVVQRYDPRLHTKRDDRTVHLLDMFGYSYEQDGRPVDVDDPPPGRRKVNAGTVDRPVWRLRRCTSAGEQEERPTGILFRLNTELAAELVKAKGSIGFTLLARRVFGVLRELHQDPGAIRLLLLVLRQTDERFGRRLHTLLDDLGWHREHPARGKAHLEEVLQKFQSMGVVRNYIIAVSQDKGT